MMSGKVLTAGFLFNCEPTQSSVKALALCFLGFDAQDFEEFHHFLETGTFRR
jgi:hypothetical protein